MRVRAELENSRLLRFGSVVQLLVDHEMCRQHNITMPELMPELTAREMDEDPDLLTVLVALGLSIISIRNNLFCCSP